jgi:hypothetical protein
MGFMGSVRAVVRAADERVAAVGEPSWNQPRWQRC